MSFERSEIAPFYVGSGFIGASSTGSVVCSPVDDKAVVGSLETGEILQEINGDGSDITCCQVTPDGKVLATFSGSQTLRLYHFGDNEPFKSQKLGCHVHAAGMDSSSTLLGFGGTDGILHVWDVNRGYATHSLKGHAAIVSCVGFYGNSANEKWLVYSGDVTGCVKIWDLVTKKCLITLREHNSPVRGIDISDRFEYLVTGGRDNLLNLFKLVESHPGKLVAKLETSVPTKQSVESCGFVSRVGNEAESNGEYVFFGGDLGHVQVYDFTSKSQVGRSRRPLQTVEELMVTQIIKLEESRLMVVLSDQTVQTLDLRKHASLTETHQYEFAVGQSYAGNHGIVGELRFCGPEFNRLVLATNSPGLRFISPFGNRFEVQIAEGHTDFVTAVDVSDDGCWVASASKDGTARLWHVDGESVTCTAVFRGHVGSVAGLSMSKTTRSYPRFIITAGADGTVKKWDLPANSAGSTTPVEITSSSYTRKAHGKDINCVDVAPNDTYFASASYDRTCKIWKVETGEVVAILEGHKRGIWKVRFCEFDRLIMTCSGDQTVKIWSLDTFKCLKSLQGHSNAVLDCLFVDQRQILKAEMVNKASRTPRIVSCGADGLVKVWDLRSEEPILTLDDHNDKIWSVASKNHGKWLATADNEGVINLWEDNTAVTEAAKQEQHKRSVEDRQSLENLMKIGSWSSAFKLALKLKHSMALYKVIVGCMEQQQLESLGPVISGLNSEELKLLFEKLRSWNVNFRYFEASQWILKLILTSHDVNKLVDIPGLATMAQQIVAYNQRHYQRLNGLLEESYVLDYTVEKLG